MPGPLIVTAELAPDDFAWLEGLRRAHYPAELNRVPAHLTMFHGLPPSAEVEVRHILARHSSQAAPRALLAGLMNLGNGVAYRLVSDDLEVIRDAVADHFHGLLSAQDSAGWRPHVTVQNKVPAKAAKALIDQLSATYHPRPIGIGGLSVHRYLGGPWERIATFKFRGN